MEKLELKLDIIDMCYTGISFIYTNCFFAEQNEKYIIKKIIGFGFFLIAKIIIASADIYYLSIYLFFQRNLFCFEFFSVFTYVDRSNKT